MILCPFSDYIFHTHYCGRDYHWQDALPDRRQEEASSYWPETQPKPYSQSSNKQFCYNCSINVKQMLSKPLQPRLTLQYKPRHTTDSRETIRNSFLRKIHNITYTHLTSDSDANVKVNRFHVLYTYPTTHVDSFGKDWTSNKQLGNAGSPGDPCGSSGDSLHYRMQAKYGS